LPVEPRTARAPPGGNPAPGGFHYRPKMPKSPSEGGWHRSETPQPLRRPTQTRQGSPARASSRGARRCWLDTTPPEYPLETIGDRARTRTTPPLTSPECISGLRIALRGAQAGVGLPTTGSSRRISGGGPKNAIITLQPPWYKFEVPQPLRRPTQTHVAPSARTPVDRDTWGFGKGGGKQRLRSGSWPLRTPSASMALGRTP
jgi:hypothetical protein